MMNNAERVQFAQWLQEHPAERYLVMVLDADNDCVIRIEAHAANAMPGVLNAALHKAANTGTWQATSPNCLERAGYKPDISAGNLNIRRTNTVRDLLHVRARLHLQIQAMDRRIAAELGHVLKLLPP